MHPIVLGIDTSGSWCSAALSQSSGVTSRRLEVGNGHSDHLLAMVDAVLVEAGVRLADCTAVAFGAGPGSFTGLRIACAVAQGLAFGAGIAVAPIGTLDAIARSVVKDESVPPRRMLVVQDARMGEVYWRLVDGTGATEVALDAPQRLHELLADDLRAGPVPLGCGNAWLVHAEALEGLAARVAPRVAADAVEVAELGVSSALAGLLVDPSEAVPLYVRNRVAETTLERAARKALATA